MSVEPTSERPIWFLLTLHWLSLLGAGLVTTAAISLLFVLPLQIRGHVDNPYLGIVVFLILPAIFFAGLFLIPVGIYLGKRRLREGQVPATFGRRTALNRLAWFLGITTLLNILIGTQVTYRAVEYMETPQFCGQSCHSMKPEFVAHKNAPHSQIECVECHVAPGIGGWIASKTAGVRQLVETVADTFPRPIPSALESNRLVSATETCQGCHWSGGFGAARLRVIPNYAEDEANTRTQTVLLMLIGASKSGGIHGAHVGPGIVIRFAAADPKRQEIPWVEYKTTADGRVKTFSAENVTPDAIKKLPVHEMQCVDCHNRPTHTFESPERGMNRLMSLGEVPVNLPFVKKTSVELLKASYGSQEEAHDKLPPAFTRFYQEKYPDIYNSKKQEVQDAAQSVLALYDRNVFPDLKVGWGTYPNNLGHTDFPGCFRCHDGSHSTSSGESISQDCSSCHQLLANDEASPEILKTLGADALIDRRQKQ
jgi:nitrate/TMAO reductase-like tetraheme cytochrome c subunit